MIFVETTPKLGASKQWDILSDDRSSILGDVTIVGSNTMLLLNGAYIKFNVKSGYNLLSVIEDYANGIDVSDKLVIEDKHKAHRKESAE